MGEMRTNSNSANVAFEAAGNNPSAVRYSPPSLTVYGTVVEFTKGSQSVGNDPSAGNQRKNKQSDPSVKENIVKVGQHPLGFGLYLFDYKAAFRRQGDNGRQFGVMADEIERIMPEAVSRDENGYSLVDYDMLGIIRH